MTKCAACDTNEARYVDDQGRLTCSICPTKEGRDSVRIGDVPELLRLARTLGENAWTSLAGRSLAQQMRELLGPRPRPALEPQLTDIGWYLRGEPAPARVAVDTETSTAQPGVRPEYRIRVEYTPEEIARRTAERDTGRLRAAEIRRHANALCGIARHEETCYFGSGREESGAGGCTCSFGPAYAGLHRIAGAMEKAAPDPVIQAKPISLTHDEVIATFDLYEVLAVGWGCTRLEAKERYLAASYGMRGMNLTGFVRTMEGRDQSERLRAKPYWFSDSARGRVTVFPHGVLPPLTLVSDTYWDSVEEAIRAMPYGGAMSAREPALLTRDEMLARCQRTWDRQAINRGLMELRLAHEVRITEVGRKLCLSLIHPGLYAMEPLRITDFPAQLRAAVEQATHDRRSRDRSIGARWDAIRTALKWPSLHARAQLRAVTIHRETELTAELEELERWRAMGRTEPVATAVVTESTIPDKPVGTELKVRNKDRERGHDTARIHEHLRRTGMHPIIQVEVYNEGTPAALWMTDRQVAERTGVARLYGTDDELALALSRVGARWSADYTWQLLIEQMVEIRKSGVRTADQAIKDPDLFG